MAKTVLITGCSSATALKLLGFASIGLALAKLFQSKGWKVAATMRNPGCDAGKELAQISDVEVYKLDIQDTASIKPTVDAVVAKFGRVDLLINNAGYGQMGLLEAMPREKMVEQFEVNVFGAADMMKAVIPHFRANKPAEDGLRGMIINVGSGAGKFTLPNMSMYCASKHALEGLTEAISYELSSQQIAVKMFDPCDSIAETNFRERSSTSSIADPALTAYNDYLEKVSSRQGKLFGGVRLTSAEVADAIHQAATDGKDKVHYNVSVNPVDLVGKRQTLGEQGFVDFIKEMYAL